MIEEAVYSEDGQLLTGSFMDYALPRATDFPTFEMHSTCTPTPVNPLGAKGVGEAGTLGSTPAVVCAAVDALSEFGVKHIDMMLKPEKLWRIIQRGARVVIPMPFEYHRASSIDDALKAWRRRRKRQVRRWRAQPGPVDEAPAQRAGGADRYRAHPGTGGHPRKGRADRDRCRDGAPCRGDVEAAAGAVSRSSPTPRPRLATRRCAIAARSAEAWPTPIRRRTCPR